MSAALLEIIIIFVLLVANGLFAMAEIALVTAKRGRLKALADAGDKGAASALALAESPNRFLSTVQIGITIVGVVAGAFGGATISARFAAALASLPFIGPMANEVAFTIVIGALIYFSLVIGELLPKRLAMLRPEAISAFMAQPMSWLSTVASPAVRFLGWSTDLLLRLFGIKAEDEKGPSKEEVSVLIREGMVTGVFHADESEMVEGIFALDQLDVSELMTPRPRILWIRHDEPHEAVWHHIVSSSHSSFPVYEGNRDNVIGVVSVKALYAQYAAGVPIHFRDLMTPPLFVPEQQSAMKLLQTFKQTGVHVAFVVNEFGSVVGMVTLVDLLEAIVGDLPTREERLAEEVKQRADGSWLLDALVAIEEVAEQLPGFTLPEDAGEDFHTLAGFIIDRLQRLPYEGEVVEHSGWNLEVIDMDGHRVDKVLATPANSRTRAD